MAKNHTATAGNVGSFLDAKLLISSAWALGRSLKDVGVIWCAILKSVSSGLIALHKSDFAVTYFTSLFSSKTFISCLVLTVAATVATRVAATIVQCIRGVSLPVLAGIKSSVELLYYVWLLLCAIAGVRAMSAEDDGQERQVIRGAYMCSIDYIDRDFRFNSSELGLSVCCKPRASWGHHC